jgi:hypothetical protein
MKKAKNYRNYNQRNLTNEKSRHTLMEYCFQHHAMVLVASKEERVPRVSFL